MKGESYAANSAVFIEDIGEGDDALVCIHNTEKQGQWIYPNKTVVSFQIKNNGFYYIRREEENLLLRRQDILPPMGSYCCKAKTTRSSNKETICAFLSKSQWLTHRNKSLRLRHTVCLIKYS